MDERAFNAYIISFSRSLTPVIHVNKIHYGVNKIFTIIELFYLNHLNRVRKMVLTNISLYGNPCTTPIARKFISRKFRSLSSMRSANKARNVDTEQEKLNNSQDKIAF